MILDVVFVALLAFEPERLRTFLSDRFSGLLAFSGFTADYLLGILIIAGFVYAIFAGSVIIRSTVRRAQKK